MASISSRSWTKQDGTRSERHQVTFVDKDGKRARRDFTTKRLAQKFIENLAAYKAAPKEPKPGPTFSAVSELYLEACEEGRDGGAPLEKKTLRDYKNMLNNRVIPLLGKKRVGTITVLDMREFLGNLLATDMSRRSMRHALFMAQQVLKEARRRGLMVGDPTEDISVKSDWRREGAKASPIKIHTKNEMALILATAKRKATEEEKWKQFSAIIHTLVYTGLRMSELRGLPATALDFEERTLKVSQRADMWGEMGPPKTANGYRTIDIPEELTTILKDWLAGRKDGLVFRTSSGRAINHTNLAHRMWQVVQKEAGVTILNPHSTRHFFASMLLDSGVKLSVLQEIVGHHDPMFTMRVYGHLFKDAEDIAERKKMASKMQASIGEQGLSTG